MEQDPKVVPSFNLSTHHSEIIISSLLEVRKLLRPSIENQNNSSIQGNQENPDILANNDGGQSEDFVILDHGSTQETSFSSLHPEISSLEQNLIPQICFELQEEQNLVDKIGNKSQDFVAIVTFIIHGDASALSERNVKLKDILEIISFLLTNKTIKIWFNDCQNKLSNINEHIQSLQEILTNIAKEFKVKDSEWSDVLTAFTNDYDLDNLLKSLREVIAPSKYPKLEGAITSNQKITELSKTLKNILTNQAQHQEKWRHYSLIINERINLLNISMSLLNGHFQELALEELHIKLVKALSLEELVNNVQTKVANELFVQIKSQFIDNKDLHKAIKNLTKLQKYWEEERQKEAEVCQKKQNLLHCLLQICPPCIDETLLQQIIADLPFDIQTEYILNLLEEVTPPKHFGGLLKKIDENEEISRLSDEISFLNFRLEQISLEREMYYSLNKYELNVIDENKLDMIIENLISACDLDKALISLKEIVPCSVLETFHQLQRNDKVLVKFLQELKQLNRNIKEREGVEFKLRCKLGTQVRYCLLQIKLKKEVLLEIFCILKSAGSIDLAFSQIRECVLQREYDLIEKFIKENDTIRSVIDELKKEWLKQCSYDTLTSSIADILIQEISKINPKVKFIKFRETISQVLTIDHDIVSLLESFIKYAIKQNIGLTLEELENIKSAVSNQLPRDMENYYKAKKIIKSIFESLDINNDMLVIDLTTKLCQTNNLDEIIKLVGSKIPNIQSKFGEALCENQDLEKMIFEKIEKDPESFLSLKNMKEIKLRIEVIAQIHKIKLRLNLKLFLLRNIYAYGLTDDWDYSEVEELDRLNIESILKKLYEDKLLKESVSKLRDYLDDTWIREELRKDLRSAIALNSEQLERLINLILEKGFINAIFEESKISLNKSSVAECLEKLEPLIQVKPIYKRKDLYSNNFEIWKNKIDDLVKDVLSHNLNNKDSETLIEIQGIVKIEKLEIDELKDIKLILINMGLRIGSPSLKSLIEVIFQKDYFTFKVYQNLSTLNLEQENESGNLLRCNLRFPFQFRELKKYFNDSLLKDPKNFKDIYEEFKQYYESIGFVMNRPESLDYLELIGNDNELLKYIILMEESKKNFFERKDAESLAQIEKVVGPRIYAKNDKLYEKWTYNNKDLQIKEHQIPSREYALYPKVILKKALDLTSKINLPMLDLRDFNRATFRISQEEQEQLIENWILGLENSESFQNLLPIYFNLLKRGEDWKPFVDKVSSSLIEKKLSTKLGFFDKKFLFYLLMIVGDIELKVKILELFGRYNPIPLRYLDWKKVTKMNTDKLQNDTISMSYEFNDLIYYIVQPSFGILSLAVGKKASLPIGKSEILNKVFKKNFSVNKSFNPFHANTIDIDFDYSFRPSRNFCIADAHGNFPLDELTFYSNLFKLFIIHIHYEDILQNKIEDDLFDLASKFHQLNGDVSIIVMIRDLPDSNNSYFYEDFNQVQKVCPQIEVLENYLPGGTFQVIGLGKLTNLNLNESAVIIQRLETLIFGTIKSFKDETTINKNSFVELVKTMQKNSPIIPIDNIVTGFMKEIEKYQTDFFDPEIFPYRDYLSELRAVEHILRTAVTEDELNEAHWRHSELQKRLRKGQPKKILELFCNILNRDESYLIVMEIANQIRDFVFQNTNFLKQEKEELLKIVAFEDLNKGQNSNEEKGMINSQAKSQSQKESLERLIDIIEKRSLSIEVIWRELMALYTYNQEAVQHLLKVDLIKKVQEFLEKGESFELIDGDNLQFNENLLKKLMQTLKGNMFNICVLGPQSSGKSTLLNYLFGSQFQSNVGRCTRGVYMSLLRVPNNVYCQYIMILDTEGLQSSEKNDKEFDRRITLFCLAISHAIIVNVKGDLHLPLKSLLESSALSLHKLVKTKVNKPSIYFVFNQNPPTKDKSPFLNQISTIMTTILSADPEAKDTAEIFQPNQDNLYPLSFAFSIMKEEKNANKNIWRDWEYVLPESSFASECAVLASAINKEMNRVMNNSSLSIAQTNTHQFETWLEMATDIWNCIIIFSTLVEHSRIGSYEQDRELTFRCEKLIKEKDSRLNGEEIIPDLFGTVLASQDQQKILELIDKNELRTNISKIKDHYGIIQSQLISELSSIKEKESYEYELIKKHQKYILQWVQFSEQGSIFILKKEILKVLLEKKKAFNTEEFNGLCQKAVTEATESLLGFETHQEILFSLISSLFQRFVCFPRIGTALTKKFQMILNNIYVERSIEWNQLSGFVKCFNDELVFCGNEIYYWDDTNQNLLLQSDIKKNEQDFEYFDFIGFYDLEKVEAAIPYKELKFLIKKETRWLNLFYNIYYKLITEKTKIKNGYKDNLNKGEGYNRLMLSELVENVIKGTNKIIEIYNQEILITGYQLDIYGRGIIYLLTALILWKLLCHEEQAVLVHLTNEILIGELQ